jgi:hypothetical protein
MACPLFSAKCDHHPPQQSYIDQRLEFPLVRLQPDILARVYKMGQGIGGHADGKGRSQAGMGAISKCQQIMIIASVHVEGFGCGKLIFVPVRRGQNDEK